MDLLLRHPIRVTEGKIRVSVPDPAAFCLHKLLISHRRRQAASREKDLEQALLVAPIMDRRTARRIHAELPKTWQRTIGQTLERARDTSVHRRHEARQLLEMLRVEKVRD